MENNFSATLYILFAIFVLCSVASQYFTNKLYKHIAEQDPAYYDKIGSPVIGLKGLRKGTRAAQPNVNLLFKTPEEFPQNYELRNELARVQKLNVAVWIVWAALLITMFL